MNESQEQMSIGVVKLGYPFLKQKGIEYIQELAGKVWTDYNEHDPGITILETLCYAIVDLEYRTNFYIEDLLAPSSQLKEEAPKHFYNVEEILPCNPLTINDFIKLVVDVPGVRNAKILLSKAPQELQGGYKVYLDLEERVVQKGQETQVIQEVRQRLYQHRNLCEDFFEISLLKPLYIQINAALETSSSITHEEGARLLAEVLFGIQTFIAPYVSFYSLRNMLIDNQWTVERIYTGPLLQQGFIDEKELHHSNTRTIIYVSEILEKITKLEKINSVVKFSVQIAEDIPDKLVIDVPQDSVPKLAIEQSKIVLYYNGSPIPINTERVNQYYDEIVRARVVRRPYLTEEEIAVPEGRYRNLSAYHSIQHEFPLAYGVGKEGLPQSVPKERKAQAQQLKGYLMFFDQFFANYLAQLDHVKDLMALYAEEPKDYFSQIPQSVPHLEKLVKLPSSDAQEDVDREFKVQRKYLGISSAAHSSTYKKHQEVVKEAYQHYLSKIVRIREQHSSKKDNLLDHLLARFAEVFTEYSLLAYGTPQEKSSSTLIQDKRLFLKDYITLSRDRNKGFDLADTQNYGWDSDNISGFERRICRFLGIRNLKRRYLYEILRNNFYVEQESEHQSLELFLGENLQSKYDNLFIFQGNFPQIKELAISYGMEEDNYEIIENLDGSYGVVLYVDKQTNKFIQLINKQLGIKSLEQADTIIKRAVKFFRAFNRESEGFHLIEHILLRASNILQGANDPYSFMMTMVFPSWPARFQKESFRTLVHELIMLESPAHVFVNVLWLDPEEMETFEKAYKEWITLRTTPEIGELQLNHAAKHLLGLIMLYSSGTQE